MKVDRYVEPAEFDKWRQVAEDMGFLYVASGPLVRSSYKVGHFLPGSSISLTAKQAGEYFIENVLRGKASERQTKSLVASESVETATASTS
jgi:lipoic acid synthetase